MTKQSRFSTFGRPVTTCQGARCALTRIRKHISDAETIPWPELADSFKQDEAALLALMREQGWALGKKQGGIT